MTELEIREALVKGLNVYCSNTGYVVSMERDDILMLTFIANLYYTRLQPSEYHQCFVETGEY